MAIKPNIPNNSRMYALDQSAANYLSDMIRRDKKYRSSGLSNNYTRIGQSKRPHRVLDVPNKLPFYLDDPTYRGQPAVDGHLLAFDPIGGYSKVDMGPDAFPWAIRCDFGRGYYFKGMTVFCEFNYVSGWQIATSGDYYFQVTSQSEVSGTSEIWTVNAYGQNQNIVVEPVFGETANGVAVGLTWDNDRLEWHITSEACG